MPRVWCFRPQLLLGSAQSTTGDYHLLNALVRELVIGEQCFRVQLAVLQILPILLTQVIQFYDAVHPKKVEFKLKSKKYEEIKNGSTKRIITNIRENTNTIF